MSTHYGIYPKGRLNTASEWLVSRRVVYEVRYAAVPKGKTVIAYCHDGFRMSLAYMQLKALGYDDVRLYNGGWGHWGNELSLPVVEGSEPFDEAFKL